MKVFLAFIRVVSVVNALCPAQQIYIDRTVAGILCRRSVWTLKGAVDAQPSFKQSFRPSRPELRVRRRMRSPSKRSSITTRRIGRAVHAARHTAGIPKGNEISRRQARSQLLAES